MTFHCFFEQSGTFKNEFKKLGYEAYDYDILNDFGETDYVVDLFKDIEDAYTHTHTRTVFDNVKEDDQIIAFFPCTRFENQINLWFRGQANGMQKMGTKDKLEYDMKLHGELHKMYCLVSKLVLVCMERNIPLVIENPYAKEHYLQRYWCIKPKVVDDNRRDRGDQYKKPTQYFFINREPSNNLIFEAYGNPAENRNIWVKGKDNNEGDKVKRSLISPLYANRFIREFIL